MSHDSHLSHWGGPKPRQPKAKPSLEEMVRADGRYPLGAYLFVFEALDRTMELYVKDRDCEREEGRHVTGQQLLEGVRRHALDQFGCMAKVVFHQLNIHATVDFGHIVFFLVDHGLMGKTERDAIDDFENQYDFDQAFEKDFVFAMDPDVDLSEFSPYYRTRA